MSRAHSSAGTERTATRSAASPSSGRRAATSARPAVGQCACGGSCPRCQAKSALRVGAPNDSHEREADAAADRVMRMQDPGISATASAAPLQRKCENCGAGEKEEELQMKSADGTSLPAAPVSVDAALRSSSQPLAGDARSFFESRFGTDFSGVRVHVDTPAQQSAREMHARAYTVGNDVVFGAGQYSPATQHGRHLLAHELTHVIQQRGNVQRSVQRDCSDENFCKPYATQAEIDSSEWWIRNTYVRAEGVETYGTEVKELYESYLDRSPGDSLDPWVYDDPASYLVSAFMSSWDTKNDMDAVIDLIGARLSHAPGPIGSAPAFMSLGNFLSASEMANRPINYSNPFSVAGHIAGGIGSSAAGDDYRKITRASVGLERTTLFSGTGYVTVTLAPDYEVFDAIDFCPGDCGSDLEQLVTIPMSRLEASGAAYDRPFKVVFSPEKRSKNFWF